MSKLQEIEGQIESLSAEEMASFRRWFAERDAEGWDRQFEDDAKAGKLDGLAQRALESHRAGQSKPL